MNSSSGLEQSMRDFAQQYAELYNKRDMKGLSELYTHDAIFYGFEGGSYRSREEIETYLHTPLPTGEMGSMVVNMDEAEAAGDVAYTTGTYTFKDSSGNGVLQGSYLTIAKRVDGVWRIYRHMSNMLLPQLDEAG